MDKAHLEMLDVVRAEVAELYRLRREDAERLGRLERLARRAMAERARGRGISDHGSGSDETERPRF